MSEIAYIKNENTPVTIVLSCRELALVLTGLQMIDRIMSSITEESETWELIQSLIPGPVLMSFAHLSGLTEDNESPLTLRAFLQRLLNKAKDTYEFSDD